MADAHPHVARRRDRVEPTGECAPDDARRRLRLLQRLLEAAREKLGRPGLLMPHAIDSIGTLLCPPAHGGPLAAGNPMAEAYRSMLVDVPDDDAPTAAVGAYPRVRVQLRTHEIVTVEEAEVLPPRQRLSCVAIRGTAELARRLDPEERAMADLVVQLDAEGTQIVARQQPDPRRLVIVLTPARAADAMVPKRSILETTLDAADAATLSALYDGAGKGRLGHVPSDPVTAFRVVCEARPGRDAREPYVLLPVWLTEHLATLAQDLFRLHVLATAAVPQGTSRLLYFDRATVVRNNDPRFYQGKEHTVIRCPLHAASSACVCALHGRSCTTPFRCLEFRIEICGAAFVERNGRRHCPRHCSEKVDCQESCIFPNVCTRCLRIDLWCCHEREDAFVSSDAPPPSRADRGVRIGMAHLIENQLTEMPKPAPGAWAREVVVDVASCACALAAQSEAAPDGKTASLTATLDLKADADGVMAAFERDCHAHGHTDSQLGVLDQTAVWMLRRGGFKYRKTVQKMVTDGKKRRSAGDPVDVGPTHGHLFPASN
jgi:hypothetical protein